LFQSGLHEFVSDAIDTTRRLSARDQQGVSLLGFGRVLMRLTVRHATTYAYEPPAERCALRLRLYPASLRAASGFLKWTVSVNGQPDTSALLTTATG
jgi:hypothetical protein